MSVGGMRGRGYPLGEAGFNLAADMIGIEAAKLWAVMEIEAKACGFLPDRRPVILFERHKFHQKTGGKHGATHPDLSAKKAGGYGKGGAHQHDRLSQAIALDREAALWSTSWGLGQIMGFNAKTAGFADAETMVRDMSNSEDSQLYGMAKFMLETGLDRDLRVGNWTSFARGYNGPQYAINKYDDRLRGAHQKYSTGPMPDLKIRQAQIFLNYLGYDPGPVDGWAGSTTMRALNAWRVSRGKRETDKVANADVAELEKAVESQQQS